MGLKFSLKAAGTLILLLLLLGCSGREGLLWPSSPSPTPIGTVLPPPIPVNFETLNADPLVFRNKMIRVDGIYRAADRISCQPYKGPEIDWHLIADGFEMNITGQRQVVELAPELASLTVDGVWRLYQGPVGCGKEPERDFVWYLETVRIVEPNPFSFGTDAEQVVNRETGDENEESELIIEPTATNAGVDQNVPSSTPSPTVSSTPTPSPTVRNSPTPLTNSGGTPSAGSSTPIRVTSTPDGSQPGSGSTPDPSGTDSAQPTATASGTDDSGTLEPTATSGVGSSGSGTRAPATLEPTERPEGYIEPEMRTPAPEWLATPQPTETPFGYVAPENRTPAPPWYLTQEAAP